MEHVLLEKSTPFYSDHSGYIYIYNIYNIYVTIRRSESYIISVVPACYFGTNPNRGHYITNPNIALLRRNPSNLPHICCLEMITPQNGSHLMIPDASAGELVSQVFSKVKAEMWKTLKPWRNGSKFIAPYYPPEV